MTRQLQKLLLLVAAVFFASSGYAVKKIDGIYYELNTADKTASVTYEGLSSGGNGSSEPFSDYTGHVIIPTTITSGGYTYSVTSIGRSAFYGCSGLTSVTIPSSVKSIGNRAFYKCSGLTSVTIPSSVTSIRDYAFACCSGLASVTIPSSVTSIGEAVFACCSGLTSVAIPSSVTSIGIGAFYGCSGLTSVTIPSSVAHIGDDAFAGCSGLTSVTIPSSVTSIGRSAFGGCSGLRSVTIPSSVTSIGNSVFSGCSGLTSVAIPSSVTNIEDGAFSGCSGLTSVTIPSFVKFIGAYAFYGCSGLKSVTIPSSVTSIKDGAFEGCSGLRFVIIPSSVEHIGDDAFSGCSGLRSVVIPSSVKIIGNSVFSGCSGLTSVTILSFVKFIGDYAFAGCSGLTSVTIPSSVTSIGRSAFGGCSGLRSVTIPSSVTSIGNSVFSGCSGLTSVTIPSSVTSIGNSVFSGCSGLTSVTIPSSVEHIGDDAFSDCSGLTSVIIPSSVKSIGDNAFSGCSLATLYFLTTGIYYSYCLRSLAVNTIIYAHSTEIDAIKSNWSGTVRDIDSIPYVYIVPCTTSLSSLSFYLEMNECSTTLQSIKLGETELTPDENRLCVMTNLEPDSPYDITITCLSPDGEENIYTQRLWTKKPEVNISIRQSTQTTMKLFASAESDITSSADKKGFICNDRVYYCPGDTLVLRGLNPNTKYDIVPFAEYGTKCITGNSISFWTESLSLTIAPLIIGPTSISVKGDYVVGDACISNTGFTDYNSGDILALNGLLPNTSYTVEYYVRTEGGGHESVSQTFTTAALELTTLQPRCVSSTCAVVAAKTNIVEEETNVGFQWKKYDAPSSLKPNEGYAAIYGGQLEGYVRNLQPTSYYNVRAFYKSAEGKYYYGDWVTFDLSDFSYFEPTVHTYAATGVTHGSARVRGYVLAGTDDIEEQGFEYWPISDSEVNALHVKAAVTDDSNVQTVLATGQVMTAELRNLRPGTTYSCRAFVKTATRTTYGETQTFTTEGDPTGIDDITIDTPAAMPTVTGYYDLSGRKSDTPHHGVNIVRYSDGSARKVIMK